METIALYILNGLSWGMLLFLISLGLTTVFGVLGVLNFAHGSLFMLGAYFSLQIMRMSHNFWLALAFAPIFVAVVGAVIEKFILKRVYVRNVSYQLLITFGILLMLDDAVRLIWGPAYHVIDPPQILSGSITVFGRAYPVYRFFLILVGPVLGIFIWAFFSFTRLGKVIRAAAFDREMAAGIGIDVNKLFYFGFWVWDISGCLGRCLGCTPPKCRPCHGRKGDHREFYSGGDRRTWQLPWCIRGCTCVGDCGILWYCLRRSCADGIAIHVVGICTVGEAKGPFWKRGVR